MKPIEPATVEPEPGLAGEIRDFWSRNVNAERIMGKTVSPHERGADTYFQDLKHQRFRSHRHLLPWIRSMKPDRTVREVGCGVGLDSYVMATHGLHLTGVDLTHVGAKTAREHLGSHDLPSSFSVADVCTLPFPENHFDYVYSFGVLHHVADTNKSISEVHRVLKRGGEARIMLYHRRSLNELAHRITRVSFEDKHELCPVVRRFTQAEVMELFRAYRNVHVEADYLFGEGYGRLFDLTPRWLYDLLSRRFGWHLMISAVK